MELSDLVTFSAVARLGGITRAAAELNTVQSNITQRVKALEAEIGTALFERHSRGMTLTGAGRRLLPYAQRMAALSREAVLAARDDGEPTGPAGDRITGNDGRGAPAVAVRRISPASSGGAVEPADRDDRRSRRRRARWVARRRLRRRPDRACRAERDDGVQGRAGAGHGAALEKSRQLACRHARKRSDGAGVPQRMHLPAANSNRCSTSSAGRVRRASNSARSTAWSAASAADMGVTLLPRAVVERRDLDGNIRLHTLKPSQSRVDTLFIQRRAAHHYSALQGFASCLKARRRGHCGLRQSAAARPRPRSPRPARTARLFAGIRKPIRARRRPRRPSTSQRLRSSSA